MDKKKKITRTTLLFISLLFSWAIPVLAQEVSSIRFCDKKVDYEIGNDSITLFLKFLGPNNKNCDNINETDLSHFVLVENEDTISSQKWKAKTLTEGKRIPSDYTISVLVDLSIPEGGKEQIFEAVNTLVESVHDSCVYLSFFGNEVSISQVVTRNNYKGFHDQFMEKAQNKYFYSAMYAKLTEFNEEIADKEEYIKTQSGYHKVARIYDRANKEPYKNLLFIFTEGSKTPKYEAKLNYRIINDYQKTARLLPKVYAFIINTGSSIDESVELLLTALSNPRDEGEIISSLQGAYCPSGNIDTIVQKFTQTVRSEMYDFALSYQVPQDNCYQGQKVNYTALWDGEPKGSGTFSIGAPQNHWPRRKQSADQSTKQYLIALLVAVLTILLFIVFMKIIIPALKSIVFSLRYYKKYKPINHVKVLICPLCRCEILPDEKVVTKCQHITHVRCWKANDYQCLEYGQNCKEGIQDHVHWLKLFSTETLRDCFMTIMGVCASLVGWVVYEISGRGFFNNIAAAMVKAFIKTDGTGIGIVNDCTTLVSSFLSIGLLLGFFLSFVFRFFDGVKRKNLQWFLEITGLSLLSSLIGMLAFALGGIILCLWVSPTDTFIPWYCSFPAYLLFSVCISLCLTIRSTIPMKSALWGGLVSSIIGFAVLYFLGMHKGLPWMNNMLDFIIYGGGLGASLTTVRMLAEEYFLVVKNGIRKGLRIHIHKWMNTGSTVTIGMTQQCEIQMAWEKSNKVAKEHVQLYVNQSRAQAMMKPLAPTTFNMRTELNSNNNAVPLLNGDTFQVGDTIFQYVES